MKETDIKYLAGLLDSDGSFGFDFQKDFVYMVINLDLSLSIDKDGKYSKWLSETLEVPRHAWQRETGSPGYKVKIQKSSVINTLIPRLLKYLVIKGQHCQRIFEMTRKLKGVKLTPKRIEELKEFSIWSRKQVGPVKSREWLSRAYVAGYLDGDGCYQNKESSGTYRITATAHKDDDIVIKLLLKQYGGYLSYQDDVIRWHRALGKSNRSFAIPFLRDMVNHSRLKKHKIESLLSRHSQRLSEETPTGEAIV